jgi:hypothetical protein
MLQGVTIPTRKARKNRVIILEDMNFIWDTPELETVVAMWTSGESVEGIAEHIDRDPDEILLALIHLARDDKIAARKLGLKGDR